MEPLYKPLTLCERSAYDSLWSRIAIAAGNDGTLSETLSEQNILSFFRTYGFSNDSLLSQVNRMSLWDDTTSSKKYSRESFYVLMRALSVAQYSSLRHMNSSDLKDMKHCDIPLFRFDRYPYSPSSACERSVYESLWYRLNASHSVTVIGSKVVAFALGSGLLKPTLSKCWNIALAESGRHGIKKEEFFVFLRCISFVQVTGILLVTRELILSTACRDFPVPDLDRSDGQNNTQNNTQSAQNRVNKSNKRSNAGETTYPSAFYFPTTRTEASAYNDLWTRASDTSDTAITGDTSSDRISAVAAVTFLVKSRLRRSILKSLWAICSPSAGPFKQSMLTREQFNTLLRGISIAQQIPSLPLTAECIAESAMSDLKLPRFDFETADDPLSFVQSPSSSPVTGSPISSFQRYKRERMNSINGNSLLGNTASAPTLFSSPPSPSKPVPVPIPVPVLMPMPISSQSYGVMEFPPAPPAPPPYQYHPPSPRAPVYGRPNPPPYSHPPPPYTAPPLMDMTSAFPLPVNVTSAPLTATNSTGTGLGGARGGTGGFISGESPLASNTVQQLLPTPSQVVPTQVAMAAKAPPQMPLSSVTTETDKGDGGMGGMGDTFQDSLVDVKEGDDMPWLAADSFKADAHEKLCVCGDMVVRFRPDCVRLRCKCMIHTNCLAAYIKSQLEDSSTISGDGIKCSYWHECHAFISMDDVDKFSAFISRNGVRSPSSSSANSYSDPSAEGRATFGSTEVDKFTRFAVAASFSDNELVYCPSCCTPFWVDEESKAQRVVCLNSKCGVHFCRYCQVQWHAGMDCSDYQMTVASDDKLSHRYVAATSKRCPACRNPFTHYHGHSCHHISPVGTKGGGCPFCHTHFCYACLSTAEENIAKRGDRKSCRCAKGKWGTFCESVDIGRYLIQDPYPHDSRCGCPICPDCRYQKPCGGLGYSGSSCDGSCVVCMGLVPPGPLEITPRKISY